MGKAKIEGIWTIGNLGRSWENCMRVNCKLGNRGHESIVNKLVINSKIVFKIVKEIGNFYNTSYAVCVGNLMFYNTSFAVCVGNYVLIIHHLQSVLGTMY